MEGFIWLILAGTWLTLRLAVYALLFGMVCAMLLAYVESIVGWLQYSVRGVIFVMRALPEVFVLFFIYFGVSSFLIKVIGGAMDISAFVAGVVTLGMVFAAYAAQILKSALLAIEQQQLEAGMALGFNRWQIFRYIQLPQVWRYALPGLGNLWLVLLKDTALVSLIGLPEMMSQTKVAASSTGQPFLFYCVAAGLYLIMTTLSQWVLDYLVKRVRLTDMPPSVSC